ncbi:MAG: hypothetical protein DRG11_00725 [Epsilonproteobacteria bacterium]|nr:MAG: hypothetical protein DRG11_00725 [Campylobacterota bacterium]
MIQIFIRLFIFCFILATLSYSQPTDYNYNQFIKYKQKYFTAILQGNKADEKTNLKKLIIFGDKANVPTKKYKKEMVKFDKSSQNIKKYNIIDQIQDIKVYSNNISINYKNTIIDTTIKKTNSKKGLYKIENYSIKGNLKDINNLFLKMDKKILDKIVVYGLNKNTIRISLRDKKAVNTTYKIKNKQIIITVQTRNKKQPILKKTKTIMLDAGHGGYDSGAVGYGGIREKDIVLSVTKKATKILRNRGYKVFNTRATDIFRQLKYRTKLANKMRADIFISIHANSIERGNEHVSGIETYYLSPARSERAKAVAATENRADIRAMDKSSIDIFLMARNRAKINESNKLALDVQNNMLFNLKKQYNNIKDHGVRKGPFWILVGAQMPAILVELGFVSNPIESKRLINQAYQQRLAIGIANGIDAYFDKITKF